MLYSQWTIAGAQGAQATLFGYVPDNSEEVDLARTRSTILIIPGGGYTMTSDREAEPIALQYVAAGYNAFILRYSCAPAVYPEALTQVAASLCLIHEHAREWHVATDRIAILGFSAGGHLAANMATSAGDNALAAHHFDSAQLRPNALMLAYPVITSGQFAHRGSFDNLLGPDRNDDRALRAVSIEEHIDGNTPPVFVWHTMTDDTVPVENSLMLISACHAAGVPVEAHLYPMGGHGLSLGTTETAWQGVNGIEPGAIPLHRFQRASAQHGAHGKLRHYGNDGIQRIERVTGGR
ncbi:alpha/beta hydrolase [Bifidobacterium magnum]|uniref:Xylan esterase n=1 Tax=Bifidobacterium magnum TaxID=1692 RepID=A0A087B823_9BIFI|nr:alpha/beta hydrolase [Bifidobacterium magnum]KFI67173.1 xylan esterase [Bifidobacterium magnum]